MRLGVAIALTLVVVLVSGCASGGVVAPQPFPRPFPRPETVPPGDAAGPSSRLTPADGYSVSATALGLRGVPYVLGGADPNQGFDCSGLVHYVFAQHGLQVPRVVNELFGTGRSVDPDDLKPGDLLFFSTTDKGTSHVGILIGGEEFVHAPSAGGSVRVDRLSSGYWGPRFQGARRIL